MTDRRVVAIAVAAGLAARMAHLAAIWGHPFRDLWRVWDQSDMYQFAVWARHLASGDWLDANTFRPYFEWQQAIAPPEVWNSWYGAGVFYQPPLYPYLLAIAQAMTGGLGAFRIAQLVMGGINCGLIALLALRLYDRRAGWIAGLASALYAPFIVYDGELLRGTVVMTAHLSLLLSLLATARASDRQARGRAALGAGLAFGVAYLADPSILLFLPLALLWLAWTLRGEPGMARPFGLLTAGAAIALAPLVARNLAVGAPPLSATTRGPLAFVMGNAPDARPAGAMIPESTGPILKLSGYRMGPTIAATLSRYEGHYGPLLRLQMEKLRALWSGYEVPDNPSLYYAARLSPVVRYGLWFLPVAGFGLVGLALAVAGARRDAAQALLPAFAIAAMAVFALAHVVSRYREPLAMALMVLGAGAASEAMRRRGRAGLAMVAAALALSLLLPAGPPDGYLWNRPAEFTMVARVYAQRGQIDAAVAELREGARLVAKETDGRPLAPALIFEAGLMLADAKRYGEAAASLREVMRIDPAFEGAAEALLQVEAAARDAGGNR